MPDKKQTALQKLKENLKIQKDFYGKQYPQLEKWIEELIEFEKETIENAFISGQENGFHFSGSVSDYEAEGQAKFEASKYYIETFKSY